MASFILQSTVVSHLSSNSAGFSATILFATDAMCGCCAIPLPVAIPTHARLFRNAKGGYSWVEIIETYEEQISDCDRAIHPADDLSNPACNCYTWHETCAKNFSCRLSKTSKPDASKTVPSLLIFS